METGLVAGVVLIGFVHGVLPDHGWPIATTYALNRNRRWLFGVLAASILGVGQPISSVVLVLAYFWFSAFAEFAEAVAPVRRRNAPDPARDPRVPTRRPRDARPRSWSRSRT